MTEKEPYVDCYGFLAVPFYDGWECEHCGYKMYRDTPYCDECGGLRQ